MQGVAFLLVLLLLTQATTFAASSVSKRLSGDHRHGCGRHIPVVPSSRHLLDNFLSGLGGPSSALTQYKRVDRNTFKDLQETEAHAGDFLTPQKGSRISKGDRRLLDNFLGGIGGPSSALNQYKRVDTNTLKDLRETEAHADDFLAPQKGSRFSKGGDRRLLDNFLGGIGGPSSALNQYNRVDRNTFKDLKETEAHASDFLAPQKGSRFSKGDR